MSTDWLDDKLGPPRVLVAGVAAGKRVDLNFTGGATATDNATDARIDVDLSGVPLAHEQASGIFRPESYGAVGDGTHDDTASLQAAIDAAIEANGGTVSLKAGRQYKVTTSLIAGKVSSGSWTYVTFSMNCEQGKCSNSVYGTGASIVSANLDLPILAIQAGCGVLIEGVRFVGPNDISADIYADIYDCLLDDSTFEVAGLRTNDFSPQCAIVVDPFHTALVAPNQYPGLAAHYHGGLHSTQIVIRDCEFLNCAVGTSWSPHAQAANGDNSRIEGCMYAFCRVGHQVLGSQARNVMLINCAFAGALFCVANIPIATFDTTKAGCPPRIVGGCAGSDKYLFAIAPLPGTLLVDGFYAEGFLSIGFLGPGASGGICPSQFTGCEFVFWETSERQIDTHLYNHGPVSFQGCTFQTSAPQRFVIHNTAEAVSEGRVSLRDCAILSAGDEQLMMASSEPGMVKMDSSYQMSVGPSTTLWWDQQVEVERIPLGAGIALTSAAGGTVTFTATVPIPAVVPGDVVHVAAGSATAFVPHNYNGVAYTSLTSVGVVHSVAGADVVLDNVAESLDADGVKLYTLEVVRPLLRGKNPNAVWSPAKTITSAESPYTVAASDSMLLVDSTGGQVVINLPAVADSRGRHLLINDRKRKFATNKCVPTADAGDTVNGAASVDLTTDGMGVEFYCDDTEWASLSAI